MKTTEIENNVYPIKFGHVNIYLVKTEKGYIIIDAGMPNQNEQVNRVFDEYDIDPKRVQLIILTLGHMDHVGTVAYVKEITGGKILCHRSYSNDLATGKFEPAVSHNFLGSTLNFLSGFLGSKMDAALPDIVVDEEFDLNEFGIPGNIIHTPGHTPGGVCLLVEDLLFTGDTLFYDAVGRWDLFGGDERILMSSLDKIKKLSKDFKILPGHGRSTTLDRELRNNPYL